MINTTLLNAERKMRSSIDILKNDLSTLRTGHATPAIIEHIKVDYSGILTSLNQIARITAPEMSILVIQPWDRNSIQNIEKAILKSELGLTPSNDGSIIRLNIPPLTEERRQELIRVVHKKLEGKRIAIRNIRHEAMNEFKKFVKNKDISEDEHKRALEQLQNLTDKFVFDIDLIGQEKEIELAEI
jgi:ribosome recycling factor